jgi:hypothetical protein
MVESTDVGSLPNPLYWDEKLFNLGASLIEKSFFSSVDLSHRSVGYFKQIVYTGLLKKLQAGFEIPCYPQYRDMKLQFRDNYRTLMNSTSTNLFIETGPEKGMFNPEYTRIAEVEVLKEIGRRICEETGQRPIEMKVCISGPITLEFEVDDYFLAGLVVGSIINTKHVKTKLITLDEPTYGYTVSGDLILRRYDRILYGAKCRNVETSIHVHSSSQRDFLTLENLDIIECHTKYSKLLESMVEDLKKNGKRLCVGIAKTDITDDVESLDLMEKRLKRAISKFGLDTVAYASPDCGMRGWISEKNALECLRRVSEVVKKLRT